MLKFAKFITEFYLTVSYQITKVLTLKLFIDGPTSIEEKPWDIFNDDSDLTNGYDRNSMMGMLFCISKAIGETNPSFVPVLVYLDRICLEHEDFVISEKNIRRLWIVAIWVSNKMFDDFFIANCCYAELLGITSQQFNFLERVFVQLLNYDLNVKTEDYKAYCAHMRDFINDTFSKARQECQYVQPEPYQQPQHQTQDEELASQNIETPSR